MKRCVGYQVQDLTGTPHTMRDLKTKLVLVAIYENDGKTVLQPLVTGEEARIIPEFFQDKTLEVWLSNGKTNSAQFDVAILKYEQVLQPLTKCRKVKTQLCLKNYFEDLASCEQCPINVNASET